MLSMSFLFKKAGGDATSRPRLSKWNLKTITSFISRKPAEKIIIKESSTIESWLVPDKGGELAPAPSCANLPEIDWTDESDGASMRRIAISQYRRKIFAEQFKLGQEQKKKDEQKKSLEEHAKSLHAALEAVRAQQLTPRFVAELSESPVTAGPEISATETGMDPNTPQLSRGRSFLPDGKKGRPALSRAFRSTPSLTLPLLLKNALKKPPSYMRLPSGTKNSSIPEQADALEDLETEVIVIGPLADSTEAGVVASE